MGNRPIILANKQDITTAMSLKEIEDRLKLNSFKQEYFI